MGTTWARRAWHRFTWVCAAGATAFIACNIILGLYWWATS